MKTIKSTQLFYVLGVKFENVPEAILYAINGWTKNGIYVGEDAKRYPCSTRKTMRQKTDSFGI